MNLREILARDVAVHVPAHSVSIMTRTNAGLATDARLIKRLVEASGLSGHIYYARRRNAYGLPARLGLRSRLLLGGRDETRINFFIQDVRQGWLGLAQRNVFVPNQEFCYPGSVGLLDRVDMVMCKSRHAEEIFRGLGASARYTGFTSDDRYDPAIARHRRKFLHVAGATKQKGTAPLLELWRAHPEWPELVAVVRHDWIDPARHGAANITLIGRRLSAAEVAVLQNECPVHICPSEAEGFGLALCEGLSCGAVVITTDGPPMNELIRPGHGILAAYRGTRPRTVGTGYFIDPAALEAAIEDIIAMGDAEVAAIGQRARRFYLEERAAFEDRFARVLADLH